MIPNQPDPAQRLREIAVSELSGRSEAAKELLTFANQFDALKNDKARLFTWLEEIGKELGLGNVPSYSHASTLSKIDALKAENAALKITLETLQKTEVSKSIVAALEDIKHGRVTPLEVVQGGGWEPHYRAQQEKLEALTAQNALLQRDLENTRRDLAEGNRQNGLINAEWVKAANENAELKANKARYHELYLAANAIKATREHLDSDPIPAQLSRLQVAVATIDAAMWEGKG